MSSGQAVVQRVDNRSAADLRDLHRGEDAVVIFGGPSLVERGFRWRRIDRLGTKIFLETKALTPAFLEQGLQPDYYVMTYPEKCKTTSFQHYAFLALLGGIDIAPLVRPEFLPEIERLHRDPGRYLEPWQPENRRKRFRFRREAYLPGSPLDLVDRLRETSILTYDEAFEDVGDPTRLSQTVYAHGLRIERRPFDRGDYYSPLVEDGRLVVRDFSFTNSAAIALFPLLRWMGFRRTFLLGLDMSMLGSMEYSALRTFRSIGHFRKFYNAARPLFSSSFPSRRAELQEALRMDLRRRGAFAYADPRTYLGAIRHQRRFLRPPSEFECMRTVLSGPGMEFVQVYEPFPYARPIEGVPRIGYDAFLRKMGAA